MRATITSEHEGWEWQFEPQDETSNGGVDVVYFELDKDDLPQEKNRFCLGTLEDAEQFANALMTYLDLAKRFRQKA